MPHTAQRTTADPGTQTVVSAMGSRVHILAVEAPDGAVGVAVDAIHRLERRWSRFRADSEISRLNAAGGRPMHVSPATSLLVALAVRGWEATGGTFDPTVLDAMLTSGYDRPFDALPADGGPPPHTPSPPPGCAAIEVDMRRSRVQLPRGVRLDMGGIGKGLADDIVAGIVRGRGAAGALVNVGGDIAVAGRAPAGDWRIDVDLPDQPTRTLTVRAGAIATSGTGRRRWLRNGVEQHHTIDPTTGTPAATVFVAATVVAGSAWCAEVLTKAAVLAPSASAAASMLGQHGATGMVVDRTGTPHVLPGMQEFLQ